MRQWSFHNPLIVLLSSRSCNNASPPENDQTLPLPQHFTFIAVQSKLFSPALEHHIHCILASLYPCNAPDWRPVGIS